MSVRVTAFGGGHGLAATLRALRLLRQSTPVDITAIVTVGDDGGSSGRLRADRGGLPPGDLRQAIAALADPTDELSGHTAELMQYRFEGSDPLAGHAVGNLILCGLMELYGDPVTALDHAGALVNAVGRVLPMSRTPISIEATVRGANRERPAELSTVRGQHAVAVTSGIVEDVRLRPDSVRACTEALTAIAESDWLLFGPGSWFTSVIPHLLVPDLAEAIMDSKARRLVMLNLAVEQETAGLSLPDHLGTLARYLPGLRVDVVLADGKFLADTSVDDNVAAAGDPMGLQTAAQSLGARVVLAPVAVADGAPRHDSVVLANVLSDIVAG